MECDAYSKSSSRCGRGIKAVHFLKYCFLTLSLTLLHSTNTYAHGGVFLEDDICVIQIGFFKAHFTIYQPQITQHQEYCEDIPNLGETIFVMEYLHDGLRNMPVDFRIIKDVQKLGRFAKLENVEKLGDLNPHTVFYQEPILGTDGILMTLHEFKDTGNFIGIVTAQADNNEANYIAVFPFQVGGKNWGYIPLLIGLAIFIQLNYWLMNGGFARIRKVLKT